MSAGPLTQLLLVKRPLILDGAMGTELQRRGANVGLPLWSAHPLLEHLELVLQVHMDYLDAGADIITADTFRTTPRTFRRAGAPDRSQEMTERAIGLARLARETVSRHPALIAASMGPLEDCYRPDLVPAEEELEDEHGQQARRLSGGSDFLLLETIGTVREAVAVCRAAREAGKEFVISFLCREEGSLYSGEPLEAAVELVAPFGPAAISVNCTPARALGRALATLADATTLPLGAYGNVGIAGGEQGEPFVRDVREGEYVWCALEWLTLGASIIGGCCGTTPEYIRRLALAFPGNDLPSTASGFQGAS